jgi:predicted Fe-S protein YdhL (DUF1289 family)
MPDTETSIQTPCNRVCVVDPTLRLCVGCGRSLEEIANWINLTDEARGRILAELPARLAAMHRATAAAALG